MNKLIKAMKPFNNCKRCGLHRYRRKIVWGRGEVPARILFIGEAPGKSEDALGKAFVGPSGRLLSLAMEKAREIAGLRSIPSYYISNVCACRPTDEASGPNRQPSPEEALACWPRLSVLYDIVKPRSVVFLGRVAETYCKEAFPAGVHLPHPAYILRLGGESSTQYRTFCRDLAEVYKSTRRIRRIG